MMRHELYKFFVKQKVWCIILAAISIRIVVMFISGYDSSYLIEENEGFYLEYLNQFGGNITSEKAKLIEEEYKRINIKNNLSGGEDGVRSQQIAFQIIYNQYKRQGTGGYLLDERGWNHLLQRSNIDYILVICITVFSTILFSSEFDSDMWTLLLTSKRGRYRVCTIKLWSGMILSVFLSFIFQLLDVIYIYSQVGLTYGEFPLNCLEFYDGTQWQFTLRQGVVCVFVTRMLGALFASLVAMGIVIFLKKTVVAMVLSLAFFLISDIAIAGEWFLYRTPIGLLKAAGYLWPSQYVASVNDEGTWEKLMTFQEILPSQYFFYVAGFILFMLALYCVCFAAFTKRTFRFRSSKRKRNTVFSMMFICAICMEMVSCGKNSSVGEPIVVMGESQTEYDGEDYSLQIVAEENDIEYTDSTGKQSYLLNEVLQDETMQLSKIFVHGETCYYLLRSNTGASFFVGSVNLKTLEKGYVYSSMEEKKEDFWGLVAPETDGEKLIVDMQEIRWFFVADNSLFYQKSSMIFQISLKTGVRYQIAESASAKVAQYEDGIFTYINLTGEQVSVAVN